MKDLERDKLEAAHGQEIQQYQQQLAIHRSQSNVIVEQVRDEKSELKELLISKEEEHQAELREREKMIADLQ